MKQVVVRPAATADIEDAYRWYESQRPGLGDEFHRRSTVDVVRQVVREELAPYQVVRSRRSRTGGAAARTARIAPAKRGR